MRHPLPSTCSTRRRLPRAAALALAAAVAALAAAPPANGGAFDERFVAADAGWMVHLDVEALNASVLGTVLFTHGDDLDIHLNLHEVKRELGLDLPRDLHGITAYGWSESEDDGVMVAVTSDRVDETVERLRQRDDVSADTITVDGYRMHRFSAEGEHVLVHVRRTTRDDRRVVVIASAPERLVGGLRVIDGKAPHLAADAHPQLAVAPARGSILLAVVSDVAALPGMQEASEIVRLSDAMVLNIGEHDHEVFARLTTSAGSRQDARDIASVVGGLAALARLIANEDDALAPLRGLADAIDVRTDGHRVTIGVRTDARALLADVEAAAAEARRDRGDDPARPHGHGSDAPPVRLRDR